ncbi:unnamed protein product [Echinostoma caproni]|uniref:Reverse transcriptase domain-containing protein n=1 Tax=Echinostoma caproni TaxID=27848 RepID=A0A183AWL4_9TREM|nr:unnamed protein product [Echinostoma caproni]
MSSVGPFKHLKQAKDPIVLKERNVYIKFSTKLALANTRIHFLDFCVDKSNYPKQYWIILRRNRIQISKIALRRQAFNEGDYVGKVATILTDESKLTKIAHENEKTTRIEESLSTILRKRKQKGFIDTATSERIRPTGTTIPRFYGLPKVHKSGVPVRPMLDMCNSPYHAVAKWLARLLETVRMTLTQHSLKDTTSLIDALSGFNIKDRHMFSLDVTPLFSNVPIGETIDYLCIYIESNGIDVGLPTDDLKELFFCTHNVQFEFHEEIYRQKDSVAMESPLGPLFADVFMSKIENDPLKTHTKQCVLYKRYVDDILCVVGSTTECQYILETICASTQAPMDGSPTSDLSCNIGASDNWGPIMKQTVEYFT